MKWVSTLKKLVVEKAKVAVAKAEEFAAKAMTFAAKVGVVVGVGVFGVTAHAQAAGTVDLTSITGAVSSGDIVTGVLAIAAVLAVAYMTIKAAKIVIAFLKGG